MKRYVKLILVLIFAVASGCTEFIATVDKDNNWDVYEMDRIVLHVRTPGHSQTASPDDDAIDRILENQNFYYQVINDSLRLDYREKVYIYLYNLDEAYFSIGTQTGGHAVPDRSSIYYTYLRPEFRDRYGRRAHVGAHEMVHVITHRLLGKPFTKMMSEGYAVAIDGAYGRQATPAGTIVARPIMEWMMNHRQAGNVLTPEQLLTQTDRPEAVYYPNAGFFVIYLWNRFGVEMTNKLFNVDTQDFRGAFYQVTGLTWSQVSEDYEAYWKSVLGE
jgi:hypothetical protein